MWRFLSRGYVLTIESSPPVSSYPRSRKQIVSTPSRKIISPTVSHQKIIRPGRPRSIGLGHELGPCTAKAVSRQFPPNWGRHRAIELLQRIDWGLPMTKIRALFPMARDRSRRYCGMAKYLFGFESFNMIGSMFRALYSALQVNLQEYNPVQYIE
jgi:hypothetical protein